MPVTPRSIEAFLTVIEACSDVDSLFAAFQDEMAREGYGDLIFARATANPADVEVVLGETSAALSQLERHLSPREMKSSTQPTSSSAWIERMARNAQADVAAFDCPSAADASVTFTIPIHGPDKTCNFISASNQSAFESRPERLAIIKLKAYATVDRYQALQSAADDAVCTKPRTASTPQAPACWAEAQTAPHATNSRHNMCAGDITNTECKALALIDIAWRRYNVGLLDLNARVAEIVGTRAINDYLARGLIEEEPDDLRFNFVFKPTRIGQLHLNACPCVSRWRAEVWRTYVEVHERPVD